MPFIFLLRKAYQIFKKFYFCVLKTQKTFRFGELLIYYELIYYPGTMFPEVLNEQVNCSN